MFDIFRVLVTKFKTGSDAQQRLAATIRQIFGDYCVPQPMVQSEAIQRLAQGFLTIYEADPRAKGRTALKNALDAANDVNRLVEADFISLLSIAAGRSARRESQRQGDSGMSEGKTRFKDIGSISSRFTLRGSACARRAPSSIHLLKR